MECWADYADSLVELVRGYYTDAGQTPPAYLQTYRNTLWNEGGLMYTLWMYGVQDNLPAFNAQVPVVMTHIHTMNRAFRTEARHAIVEGWESRGDVSSDYSSMRDDFISCIEGGDRED
ncbi:MAG TPA: hypothetical protein EYP34_15030 [Chromatiaceae bacterium]|nr:hypothetical protein [Chromatiaceae bacterium]